MPVGGNKCVCVCPRARVPACPRACALDYLFLLYLILPMSPSLSLHPPSPFLVLLLSDPSSSQWFHRPPLTPLCRETKKEKKKHNRLVLFLILISSSKFDNYTFSLPHEFLCSVHIREKAIDSAVEGSNYWEWLTTVPLPLRSGRQ